MHSHARTAIVTAIITAIAVGLPTFFFAHYCVGPNPDDGNPVGFRLTGLVKLSASPAPGCVAGKACWIEIDLQMPNPVPSPSPAPSSCPFSNQCATFTGSMNAISYDWNGVRHPVAATAPSERRQTYGTIYISQKSPPPR